MGDKVLNKLRNDPDFSETPLEQVEGFLFSRAKEVGEPVTVTGFDINSFGVPLWHWFHANKNGHSAAMVPIVQTGEGYYSMVCELDFTKVSEPDQDNEGKWIDTWSIALRISEQTGLWNPPRGSMNMWVGPTNLFHGVYSVTVDNAPYYCYYTPQDSLEIKHYRATDPIYEVVDPGWEPAPVMGDKLDYSVAYCGLVNATRIYRSRNMHQKFSFGQGSEAETSFDFVNETRINSSGGGGNGIGSSYYSGGCDITDLGEITGAYGTLEHPAEGHLANGTRVDSYWSETRTAFAFAYIPLNDAEACFIGSRQTIDKTAPDITTSQSGFIYKTDHYHWKPASPEDPDYGTDREHVGDFVGSVMEFNSTTFSYDPNNPPTYVQGQEEYVDSRKAMCHLLHKDASVDTAGHNSLYLASLFAQSSTGFAGYVQQSALTGKAVYSSGDGLAGDAPCGSPMGYYDVFTGLV